MRIDLIHPHFRKENISFSLTDKFWVFIFFITLYLLSTSGGVFHSVDGQSMYSVGKNIFTKFSATTDGKNFSQYPPLQSLLEGIGYACGSLFQKIFPPLQKYGEEFLIFSALSVNIIISALTCLLIMIFAQALFINKAISVGLSIFYGLSTSAWVYAKWDQAEPLANLLILLASYYLYLFSIIGKKKNLFLSGSFLGLAIATKYYPIIILPGLILYLFMIDQKGDINIFWKDLIRLLIPLFSICMLLLFYNWIRFNNPFETNYPFKSDGGIDFRPEFIYTALYGLLFSAGKGFFFYNPLAFFSLFGFKRFYEYYRRECIYFLTIIFSFVFYFVLFINWQGGHTWGLRYFLIIVPYLLFFAASAIKEHWRKSLFRFSFYFLLLYGIFVQLLGISVNVQHFYGSVMKDQLWHWVYLPFFSPIIGNFWILLSMITGVSFQYPALKPFDLYLGSVSGSNFDLFFINNLINGRSSIINCIAVALTILLIFASFKIWKRFNFKFRPISPKSAIISSLGLISIFFILSPVKKMDILNRPKETSSIAINNPNLLIDHGENYGSGDTTANNNIPDGWELGDWSPIKPSIQTTYSTECFRYNARSFEIKTLVASYVLFRLRTGLIPISSYKRLLLSSYLKHEDGISPIFWLTFFDKDLAILSELQGIKYFNKEGDWNLGLFECVVPEGAYKVQISLALWGDVEPNRRLWIDEIFLSGMMQK